MYLKILYNTIKFKIYFLKLNEFNEFNFNFIGQMWCNLKKAYSDRHKSFIFFVLENKTTK